MTLCLTVNRFICLYSFCTLFQDANQAESESKYFPNWESLDSRPLPSWYDQAKIGVKFNWGIFSVVGIDGPWFWHCWKEGTEECVNFVKRNFKPGTTYQDLIPLFSGEFFNASEWVDLAKVSGAKYAVITEKHHDGFPLFPSRQSFGYNSLDAGIHRDVLGEFETALRSQSSLKFGIYHSLLEWYNPLYMSDKERQFSTNTFIKNKMGPELHQLVIDYKPDIIWSDGDWEATDVYWNSTQFISWLYNSSPVKDTVVTNDRWGKGTWCAHGGFLTCTDRYNPKKLVGRKWENCMSLHRDSWAFRMDARIEDFLTPEELMDTMVETVACGGNLLVNFGPTKEGTIQPLVQERLKQLGDWLSINGEAIYNTIPWKVQSDSVIKTVWYTGSKSGTIVYAFLTGRNYPKDAIFGAMGGMNVREARMLGYNKTLYCVRVEEGLRIVLPDRAKVQSNFVWVIAFSLQG